MTFISLLKFVFSFILYVFYKGYSLFYLFECVGLIWSSLLQNFNYRKTK